MSIQTYWRIDAAAEPTRSEQAARPHLPSLVRDLRGGSSNRYDYYTQIAQAAAQTGFDGVFLPYRREADESRIIAAVVARAVPRIGVIPEFPTSIGSAVYAAKQATTFQRSTHDRLGWAIAPDADAKTRAAEGDLVPEEELSDRLDEFLTVARGVHTTRPFSFTGKHFEVENGGFEAPLNRVPFPTLFLQGESEEALSLSARHADVHLFAPAPVERLASLIEALDGLANRAGRSVAFGLLQPIVTRELAEDAERISPPEGTLTGSHDSVAVQLAERAALGITHFVLSASPSLEEGYRVGQHLLPRLRTLTGTARAAA
ncbi:MAG TPA: LLM class flavin-dependent oxidoreductase [Sphingobium sp.]|uniref:LLM class flavin-dependent oxidoreductase n=1 Tax=Sphingobium sp. TaxID=1912891 RepID=UPI002ED570F7